MSQHRIYFVGAHSTGKTTLARWVRDRFDLPMIAEVGASISRMPGPPFGPS